MIHLFLFSAAFNSVLEESTFFGHGHHSKTLPVSGQHTKRPPRASSSEERFKLARKPNTDRDAVWTRTWIDSMSTEVENTG